MDRKTGTSGRDTGFTLAELLVVVVVIGILAAIAIPVFLRQRQKGFDAQAKSDLRSAATLEETYLAEHRTYAGYVDLRAGLDGMRTSPDVVDFRAVPQGAATFCVAAKSRSGRVFRLIGASGGAGVEQTADGTVTDACP